MTLAKAEYWIRTLVVDGDGDSRRRIAAAALAAGGISLTGAVAPGSAATAMLIQDAPDVLVVDLLSAEVDPIRLVRLATSLRLPGRNVMLLASHAEDRNLLRGINAGASGCWLKGRSTDGIGAAIREMHAGGSPISPGIGRFLLQNLRQSRGVLCRGKNDCRHPENHETELTSREIELLVLVAKGLTIETIAFVAGISTHTVVTHLKNVYRKLKVHSRAEAVFEAFQLGLVESRTAATSL